MCIEVGGVEGLVVLDRVDAVGPVDLLPDPGLQDGVEDLPAGRRQALGVVDQGVTDHLQRDPQRLLGVRCLRRRSRWNDNEHQGDGAHRHRPAQVHPRPPHHQSEDHQNHRQGIVTHEREARQDRHDHRRAASAQQHLPGTGTHHQQHRDEQGGEEGEGRVLDHGEGVVGHQRHERAVGDEDPGHAA